MAARWRRAPHCAVRPGAGSKAEGGSAVSSWRWQVDRLRRDFPAWEIAETPSGVIAVCGERRIAVRSPQVLRAELEDRRFAAIHERIRRR